MMRTAYVVRRFRLFVLALLAMACCLCWPQLPFFIGELKSASASTSMVSIDLNQQVRQGVEAYRASQYKQAIEAWQAALTQYSEADNSPERATVLENLARAYQQLGEPSQALIYWQQSTAVHVALQNGSKVSRSLTQQAQAYGQLGQPYQSVGLLCASNLETGLEISEFDVDRCEPQSAVTLARRVEDTAAEVAALGSLSEAYRSIGRYELSVRAAELGLERLTSLESVTGGATDGVMLAQETADSDHSHGRSQALLQRALLQNSLGNALKDKAEFGYQQAVIAQRSLTRGAQALLNTAREDSQAALENFEQSGAIAQQTGYPALQIKTLLGQIAVNAAVDDPAISHNASSDDAFSNGAFPNSAFQNQDTALRNQAIALLDQLPPNQEKVYLTLQLAKRPRAIAVTRSDANSSKASRSQCLDIVPGATTAALLQQAVTLSTELHNNRLISFSQGEIGHYYECIKDYDNALTRTQQARLAASGDRVLALDTLYLWQWQTGRIYNAQGQVEQAIEYYTQAVDNLDRVRAEILASDRNLQFDFRDSVAPVYRELAEIRLALVPSIESERIESKGIASVKSDRSRQNIRQNVKLALGNIDRLQLAELQNYFGSDCLVPVVDLRLDDVISNDVASLVSDDISTVVQSKETNANDVDTDSPKRETALISTVIFPDRTAVILTLPNQLPLLHWINLAEDDLRSSVIAFRSSLQDTANELEGFDTRVAQQLYQQIIAPFDAALTASHIKTLVFMNDGILRNIPMAALYDGQQYLVEKYALALAPSLQKSAVTTGADTLPSRALILGLSENSVVEGQRFAPLPAVEREVKEVLSLFPKGDLLLNDAFTPENLKQNLSDRVYPILHIATHGKFESTPSKTFLVTGEIEVNTTENKPLRLGELDSLVRAGVRTGADNPSNQSALLDLIVLSACQTATGDERSSLGLAGVTIRAGASTALASLWSVNDAATADLITYFYQNWNSGLSKSEALQQAQIAVIKDPQYLDHPAYWSAFLLIGDWQ